MTIFVCKMKGKLYGEATSAFGSLNELMVVAVENSVEHHILSVEPAEIDQISDAIFDIKTKVERLLRDSHTFSRAYRGKLDDKITGLENEIFDLKAMQVQIND